MQEQPNELPVWTYRGYKLRPSEFNTALVHFYRAEISRANAWRSRLDVTTNWALVATGAAITFGFSEQYTNHSIIILNTFLITLFLFIEARRYRYYELWSYRVRLIETDFYAAMLIPPFKPRAEWSEKLAHSLLAPRFPISVWEAFGRRLRRNYLWIYAVLLLAWLAKLLLYPLPIETWEELVRRAHIGIIPGAVVLGVVGAYYLALVLIAVLTFRLRASSGEVLSRHENLRQVSPRQKGVSAQMDVDESSVERT